ncbi:Shikimate kinase 1 [Methyloligella halotolerans]|uniref:Shikimate kinase n=1 Tax=Methyloligella halotolerans TaxID=1177755 RepID=A0A1E2RV05_9HYPH|nr:shikimate kinase [Methyloligella halotolerans]ODA66077.1 Shikimate kinase 1 [Methyloligella halotolerans]
MSLPRQDPKQEPKADDADPRSERIRAALGARSLVLIGLMGAGKSSVGKRLAGALGLPFTDADHEIEVAAGESIQEIFADHGEAYFRDGERKVIARLLTSGPQVLATGGGAFMDSETRNRVAESGLSIWLRAELPVLMKRVRRRSHRPLLATGDARETMKRLMDERYPVYAQADLVVDTKDAPHDTVVGEIVGMLDEHLFSGKDSRHGEQTPEGK